MFGMIFGLTQYLQFVLGKTALEAGALMLALAVGMPIGARISLKAVEHFGTNKTMAGGLVLVALLLLSLTRWTPSMDALVVSGTLFFFALAMANVMAPGTGAVMGAVPEAKAGVGSAMNDLLRQLGGALGVAVIGSVINTVYRDRMTDAVAGLPPAAAAAAHDSVGAAVTIGNQIGGPAGQALAGVARAGFVDALGAAALLAAGVAVLTAVFVARVMPARAPEAEPEGASPTTRADRPTLAPGS